jgi:hypothetical protein
MKKNHRILLVSALFAALLSSGVFSQAASQNLNNQSEIETGSLRSCCEANDPVDSNYCFDSWEEFAQACRGAGPDEPEDEFPSRSEDEDSDLF